MNLIKSYLTGNDCYKLNKKITVKGLMLHSVGCPQPSALIFIGQWNKTGVQKAVHAFIEATGNVYQTLPWDLRGWHGGGHANNTHIGVEMTEPSTIKYTDGAGFTDTNPLKTKEHVLATYDVAVELFTKLCIEFDLDPLAKGVVISHSEGHKMGIASAHADVEHLWSKFGLTMDKFRKDIKARIDGNSAQIEVSEVDYKPLIQAKCKFSNPDEVFGLIDQHKYANAVYKKLYQAMI